MHAAELITDPVTGEEIITGFMNTPVGVLRISGTARFITEVNFTGFDFIPGSDGPLTPVIEKCRAELEQYFNGALKIFSIPLSPEGTGFQKRIWQLLLSIPYGTTCSYYDLAKKSGDANNTRAVGNSNGKNKIAIIIPCHRVIGMNGNLTGYAGGMWRKKWLLDHESKIANGVMELF
jgi:methylated-DNA-[protein]-cysteine S-methyltransferase